MGILIFDSWQDVINTIDFLNQSEELFLTDFHENSQDASDGELENLEFQLRNDRIAPIEKFVGEFESNLFYNSAFPAWDAGDPLEDELKQFALNLFNDPGVFAVINQDFELIVDDTVRNLLADVFSSDSPLTEPVDIEEFALNNDFCPVIAYKRSLRFITESSNPRLLILTTTHYRIGKFFGAMRVTAKLENFKRKGSKWKPKRENIAVSTGGVRVNSNRCDDNSNTIVSSGIARRKRISTGKFYNEPRAKLYNLPWAANGTNSSANHSIQHSY